MNTESMVQAERIGKTYVTDAGHVVALEDVTVTIARGEFVAIMGPSGSGKSTFMNIIGCLDVPTQGDCYLSGKSIRALDVADRAELRNSLIGFVFQGYNLLPRLTNLENVGLPLVYAGASKRDRQARAHDLLVQVGLSAYQSAYPSQLSGGQQQRVAIARALVNNAPLLLADEPTGNLDSHTSLEILTIFERLNKEQQLTIILVTHDLNVAKHAVRLIRFLDGKVQSDTDIATAFAGLAATQ